MWSWLIIILITLSCLFCFISVVQLELKRPNAKIWIILTCLTIGAVVGTLLSVPSPILQKYSYEPKPADIQLKELKNIEEQDSEEQTPEQNDPQEETGDENTESTRDTQAEEVSNEQNRVLVMVPELNVRSDSNTGAQIIGNVRYGEILSIIEAPEGLDWVKVRIDSGLTGWVLKRYLNDLTE